MKLFLLFFALTLLINPTCGQGQGKCLTFNNTMCEPFVKSGTVVWYANTSITLEDIISVLVTNTRFISSFGIPDPCRSSIYRIYCHSFLRECVSQNNSDGSVTYLPYPIESCRDICTTYVEECTYWYSRFNAPVGYGTFLPENALLPIACDEIDPQAQNTSFFPISESVYSLPNGTDLVVPCNNQSLSLKAPVNCKAPLVQDYANDECGFPCPIPSLTDSEYNNAQIMQDIVGWISWTCTWVIIGSYLIQPSLRAFPKCLILFVAIAANIAAGAIVLPSFAGYSNIWCGSGQVWDSYLVLEFEGDLPVGTSISDTNEILFYSSACTFQGAMLLYGFLSAVFWWVIIAFNMCFEMYLATLLAAHEVIFKWVRIVGYHIIGWGLPFVLMVIPAAAGRINFAASATYCFVSPEDGNAWQIVFWFVPVGVSLLLGTIFFVASLIRIMILCYNLKKFWQLLAVYLRIICFLLLYVIIIMIVFAYNIQLENNKGEITTGLQEYYVCLITSPTPCTLSDTVSNYNLVMLKGFAISSLGFFIFLTFISGQILKFYYLLIKKAFLSLIKRDRRLAFSLLSMVINEASSTSLSRKNSTNTLDITVDGVEDNDYDDPGTADDSSSESHEEEGEGGTQMTPRRAAKTKKKEEKSDKEDEESD